MEKRFLTISSKVLPEPIQLVIDSNLVIALSKKDEAGKVKAANDTAIAFLKKDEDLLEVIKVISKVLSKEEDWVFDKFVKGMMFQDPFARRLFIRRDWNDENGPERIRKYFERYKSDGEINKVPSVIVSCIFAALSGLLNYSDTLESDGEILPYILPIMETPEEENISNGIENTGVINASQEDYNED